MFFFNIYINLLKLFAVSLCWKLSSLFLICIMIIGVRTATPKIAKNNYDIGNNVRNRLIQKLRDDAQKKSIDIANQTVRMNMFPRGSQAGSGTYTRVSTSGTNFTIEWNMVGGAVIGNGNINGTVEREFRLNTTTEYIEIGRAHV